MASENKNNDDDFDDLDNNNNNNNKNNNNEVNKNKKGKEKEQKKDNEELPRINVKKLLFDEFTKQCGGNQDCGLYKIGDDILKTYQYCNMTRNNVNILIETWNELKADFQNNLKSSTMDLGLALGILKNTMDILNEEQERIKQKKEELKIINKKSPKQIIKQAKKRKLLIDKETRRQTTKSNKSFVDVVLSYVST